MPRFVVSSSRQTPILPFVVSVVLAAWLAGCAGPELIVVPDDPPSLYAAEPVSVEEGKASYYWQPQPVASGGRFDPEAMTAAHKKLPFGTTVRATNLRNGRSVIVKINDRGPYIRGRIIDLSRAAAREIDMVKAGVVPIRVEVLRPIELVQKPNLRLTPEIRERARAKADERARESGRVDPEATEEADEPTATERPETSAEAERRKAQRFRR